MGDIRNRHYETDYQNSVLPDLPCSLPDSKISPDVDVAGVAATFERKLENLSRDELSTDAMWRDVFAFTGSLRTFYGADNIFDIWKKLTSDCSIEDVKLMPGSYLLPISEQSSWIEAVYSFEVTGSSASKCTAALSLVRDEGGTWRIWVLRTVLDQIHGFPNVDKLEASEGTKKESSGDATEQGSHFDCVVVGAGQAGLSTAGRLKALGLNYVLIDKNENIGDNWRLRYDSLKLHTTTDSSHLPFGKTFPPAEHGKYLSKDELADGYNRWAKRYDINFRGSTMLQSGQWDESQKQWTLNIADAAGEFQRSITSRHVVMANGAGGQIPKMPEYPGTGQFEGTILHSSRYKSAKDWKGQTCIVIGAGTTGHDVARDMVEAGCASVTMVQRSPTYVYAAEYFEKVLDMVYNEHIPTNLADMLFSASPNAYTRLITNLTLHGRTKADPERYDAMERAGYKLIRYGDVIYQLYERYGGHYMDIGAVAMIADGSIKMKTDAVPVRFEPNGVVFSDDSVIPAEIVVIATGFQLNTKNLVRDMFGSDVADRVEEFWGIDSEGEIRGAFRPTGHPQLWMVGGSTVMARYFSRFVALHIYADVQGSPLKIYKD